MDACERGFGRSERRWWCVAWGQETERRKSHRAGFCSAAAPFLFACGNEATILLCRVSVGDSVMRRAGLQMQWTCEKGAVNSSEPPPTPLQGACISPPATGTAAVYIGGPPLFFLVPATP